jgi:hypothetical protein
MSDSGKNVEQEQFDAVQRKIAAPQRQLELRERALQPPLGKAAAVAPVSSVGILEKTRK